VTLFTSVMTDLILIGPDLCVKRNCLDQLGDWPNGTGSEMLPATDSHTEEGERT